MVLIYSNSMDWTTHDVINWLSYYGAIFYVLNNIDFSINTLYHQNETTYVIQNSNKLNLSNFTSFWFRRYFKRKLSFNLEKYSKKDYFQNLKTYIDEEQTAFRNVFFESLKAKRSISRNVYKWNRSKLEALLIAQSLGLKTPSSIITNDKSKIQEFKRKHKKIITKPLQTHFKCKIKEQSFNTYTNIVSTDLENFPSIIFPILVQEKIEKKYEIRSFFLKGKFWSMAIFSQADEQTSVDMRKYNHSKPNRVVPFNLPNDLKEKLLNLMTSLDLDSGSIDIIRTQNDEFVFLEVNPIGQFGYLSRSCNYFLEKEIAKYLTFQK